MRDILFRHQLKVGETDLRRLLVACVAILLMSGTWAAAPASASTSFAVAFSSQGVFLRTGPSLDYGRVGKLLPNGSPVTVVCEQTGRAETNVWGQTSTIWERLSDGRWIPNVFLATGVDGWTPGVPRCGFAPSAARSWAVANYRGDARGVPDDAECAWFVSHALWVGGLAMTPTWNDASPTSPTVVGADRLVRSLVDSGSATRSRLSWGDPSAGGARVGDVIAYDLYPDNGVSVDHVAVVTGITSAGYRLVTQRSPSQTGRGWSYSDAFRARIDVSYPGASADVIRVVN